MRWLVPHRSSGCGPQQVERAKGPVFYPPAPDPPRLQFLMSFSNAQGWTESRTSFADFIVGKEAVGEGDITAPYGLAARDGKVYICDLGNRTVHVVDMANKTYTKLGGSKLFQNPVNITIAPDGTEARLRHQFAKGGSVRLRRIGSSASWATRPSALPALWPFTAGNST